jgi:outer membrane protein insertion porin family
VLYNSLVIRSTWRPLILPILLGLLCAVDFAQNGGKSKLSYKLLSIHVKGLTRFNQDQVVAASGLKLGQFADENDFKQTAKRLGETGLFTELTYSYQYSPAGCNLELQVTENDKLVPVLFDNFVWFSDDELISLLHARLPLFDGHLPLGGNLGDQISEGLNSILAERKISGQAEYLPFAPENGPVESYVYRVSFRPVLVRNMEFPGAAPAEVPALQAVAKPLAGQDYLRTKMRVQERLNFLPVYRARGYLKAQFSDAQARVAEDGPQTMVDVSFPVAPGLQYKLSEIQWAGNAAFPADKLQALIHLKTGEPADAVQLADDLQEIQKLYGTKGYLFAHVEPTPEMDDSQATVRYDLGVTEGDFYRMGELKIDGVSADSSQKIATQWQMKTGDPFDDSYLNRFFKTLYRDVGLSRSMNVVPRKTVNQQNKTVSVSLHFVPKG